MAILLDERIHIAEGAKRCCAALEIPFANQAADDEARMLALVHLKCSAEFVTAFTRRIRLTLAGVPAEERLLRCDL